MKGLYCVKKNHKLQSAGDEKSKLDLLLQRGGVEVMRQTIDKYAAVWLTSADDPTAVEFFFVLTGEILLFDVDPPRRLFPGDYFYVESLEQDFRLEAAADDTSLLYITNRPVFAQLDHFHSDLQRLLDEINDTDRITYQHSKNVMRYALKLLQKLNVSDLLYDDLASAALFHDVGKCRIPAEILKKNGPLTPDEYQQIKRHPLESYDILLPYYNERVAGIARWHHERLDGSGYPDRLKGEDICIGARIVAVADAYDAMTSWRTYSRRKTPEEAIMELRGMPNQYDAQVVAALDALYREGALPLIEPG